jgi:hypothetical protein
MVSKYLIATAFTVLLFESLTAQGRFKEHEDTEVRNKGKVILAHVAVGAHLPAADMGKRFGPDYDFGAGVDFVTADNWIFGLEGHYFFGNKVKEDPLEILRTPEGDIIGKDESLADVNLRERGFYVGGLVGRLFVIGKERSGIRATLGAGMLQHHIRILDNSATVAELTGSYINGYDRLTGGFAMNQFIGWQHLGKNRRANFFIGFEFNEGLTTGLRTWDFDLMRKLDNRRFDLRIGLRAAFTLPFYVGEPEKIFY